MNPNHLHSVVFSPCGGTSHVLRAVCGGTGATVIEHNITTPAMRNEAIAFTENDLVYIAFPVYGGLLPVNAQEVFQTLSGKNTPAVLVAVYGNRAWEGALVDMHQLVVERGFKPIAAAAAIAEHSIITEIAAHRPDAADTRLLAQFGRKSREHAASNPPMLPAPGKSRTRTQYPKGTAFIQCDETLCTGCGICVNNCPTAAIQPEAPQDTNPDACIVCTACVKYCPEKARAIIPPVLAMTREHLQHAHDRKEPEFFF